MHSRCKNCQRRAKIGNGLRFYYKVDLRSGERSNDAVLLCFPCREQQRTWVLAGDDDPNTARASL